MDRNELVKKITKKKEYSKLPKKDVETVFNQFDKNNYTEEEKVKKTRDLLRKVFSVFTSGKLLNIRDKDPEWFLKKHVSTRERFDNYKKIYSRIFGGEKKELCLFDLGAGVNGFSFRYMKEVNPLISYIGIEAMGQLVDLMNYYFKTRGFEDAHAIQMSLFDLDKLIKLLKQVREEKIVFLFKTLDSLEMLERNYSKKLLEEISKYADKIVVSFATQSIGSRKKFHAKRNWIVSFIGSNFKILDDFDFGGERYIVFE